MTSDRVYVWTWLPGDEDSVVAGALEHRDRLETRRLTSSVATRRADPGPHAGFARTQGRLEA